MNRYLTGLQEALQAEAGAGELLADVTADRIFVHRADRDAELPLIVVWDFQPKNIRIAHGAHYRISEYRAMVNVFCALSKDAAHSTQWTSAIQLLEKMEAVLLDNPFLKTTSYVNGLIQEGDRLRIESSGLYEATLPEVAAATGKPCFMGQLFCIANIIQSDQDFMAE